MSIIVLKLPEGKVAAGRPAHCPACKGEILQRWSGQMKRVRDPYIDAVLVYRDRCCGCRHTFRHYPSSVYQAQQTQRLRQLAGLCWVLGLSYRGIAAVFAVFRVGIIPWDLYAFLDFSTKRIFLRKVGNGYIFIHRMLMEHFAEMATDEAGVKVAESAATME